MVERAVPQINMPLFAPYRHSAAPGFLLEGDLEPLAQLLDVWIEDLEGTGLTDWVPARSAEQFCAELTACIKTGSVELFLPLTGPKGPIRWFLNRGKVATNADGSAFVEGVLVEMDATYHQLTAQHEAMERYRAKLTQTESMVTSLQVRAEQDSLTRLLNARTTRELTEAYLKTREKPCALIIIDVDNFKRINDRFGHLAGDKAMTGAAAAIKKLFRVNDIVGRVGGDEFLVLMQDVAQQEIVDMRCDQIVRSFHELTCDQFPGGTMSCSVGAVFATVLNCNYDELFSCADKAMYRSKTAGGDRFSVEVL